MSAKSSTMSSAKKTKEMKLKKQHSSITDNKDSTSQWKESPDVTPTAGATNKDKDATDDKSLTNEEKFRQFDDDGVVFKTKLIGSELVMEPRGDRMCQNSIQRLKAIIKGQKAHKKRIVMKISYSGVKIYDEKTNELLYHHEVPQISFISSDDTDSRTFGYVCDVPNKAHQFICFKTSGPALQVMSVISSLFEAVLEKKKREEQESGDNNNSSSMSNNNMQQGQERSGSILDDQLIIQDKSITPPPAETSVEPRKHSQESATAELTRQLGHTLSFSSPMDLIDGGDSGIIESPSTTFDEWSLPPPPPPPPHQSKQAISHKQPPAPIPEKPSLLSLNSSSPVTTSSVRMGTPAASLIASNRVLPGAASHQNRSLIYNHSSVSLNDAALSNRSSFVSPTSAGYTNEGTDRYAVFNDIDNLPSIFESTSSLGSKTNLSNATGAVHIPTPSASTACPFDQHFGGPPQAVARSLQSSAGHSFDSSNLAQPNAMFFTSHQVPTSPPGVTASGDLFQGVDQQQHQQQQQTQYQQQRFQQPQQHLNQQRPAPTPSMMVPNNPITSSSHAFGPNSGSGMIVGSAPMGGHQMSAHARFSSSMVAGLHQRLGSSAASIQSVGSAGGLSRQTNPFDDDFFS